MKKMKVESFGETRSGQLTYAYTLMNEHGMSIMMTDFGATLVKIIVPDSNDEKRDVILGYSDVAGYEQGTTFHGAIVGRNANRIGGASICIEGTEYPLVQNDNDNNLHSGPDCFNKRIWKVTDFSDGKVSFCLISEDGDQGYPGNASIMVTYELTEDDEVRITYDAISDKSTIFNLTNHSYFNLNGHDGSNILEHVVTMNADYFTRADAHSIPTGELVDVTGTPMDFRSGRVIGEEIDSDYEALQFGSGYDHNWVLKNNGIFDKVAEVTSSKSGITMEVYTDLPGVQLYTGNFIAEETGKEDTTYGSRMGVCFETQYFPDAVHHENFASPIVRAGEKYHTVTGYRFRKN